MSNNDIKIKCPKCHKEQSYGRVLLVKTKGHVICKDCQHMFQVVKKPRTAANTNTNGAAESRKPSAPQAASAPRAKAQSAAKPAAAKSAQQAAAAKSQAADNFKAAPAAPNIPAYVRQRKAATIAKLRDDIANGRPITEEAKPKRQPEKTVSAQTALHKAQKPISYRVPTVEKAKPQPRKLADSVETFAEVGAGTMPFTLPDRDSIKMQLPQVLPPASELQNGAGSGMQGDQQNNITIRTDNLVFTLMGDQQGQSLPNTQASGGGHMPPPPVYSYSHHQEMNLVIAIIVALIIFVIQLFYLVVMITH